MAAKESWNGGDVDGARQILSRAFESNPDSEGIWLAAVKLEAENGQIEAAKQLMQRAREVSGTERVRVVLRLDPTLRSADAVLASLRTDLDQVGRLRAHSQRERCGARHGQAGSQGLPGVGQTSHDARPAAANADPAERSGRPRGTVRRPPEISDGRPAVDHGLPARGERGTADQGPCAAREGPHAEPEERRALARERQGRGARRLGRAQAHAGPRYAPSRDSLRPE